MSKWLKEPLLHFLVLGALVFLVYDVVSDKGRADNEIFISKGQQQNLLNTFQRTWQRLPTGAEYQGLLRDYIRQEIAYRESQGMGLDQDDIVIRRRLRQKMEMLAEDVAGLVPPTDPELQAFLDENPERFMIEPRLTLQQIYFSLDRRGDAAHDDALQALSLLESGDDSADPMQLGDPLPLPAYLPDAAESEVERLFGMQFVEGTREAPSNRWTGPVSSGFGLHLVYVSDRVPARMPGLDEAKDDVQRELMSLRRQQSVDGLYDKLAENYIIEIEPLTDPAVAEQEGQ